MTFAILYQAFLDSDLGGETIWQEAELFCQEHGLPEETAEDLAAYYDRQAALEAGIPEEVIDGKAKLTDFFNQSYIDYVIGRK